MNDIVHQLRQASLNNEDYRWQAADLIQSLREKTQYWPDNAERDAVIRHQKEEIERLRAALRDAYEIYAGSDGFIPITAAEGYQQQIIRQMAECISSALERK